MTPAEKRNAPKGTAQSGQPAAHKIASQAIFRATRCRAGRAGEVHGAADTGFGANAERAYSSRKSANIWPLPAGALPQPNPDHGARRVEP